MKHWNCEEIKQSVHTAKNKEPWLSLAPAPRICRIGLKFFGGFLTLCSSILSPTSTGCQIVRIVKLHWVFINIYANLKSFQAILNSLKLNLIFLLNHWKTIMTGDFIALSYGNFNSSSKFKLTDARIKPITPPKKKFLIVTGFVD